MAAKTLNYLGMYIDYNTIVVSQAEQKAEKLLIKKVFSIEVNYKVEGLIKPLSLNNDFFNEKQPWVSSLKENFKKVKVDSNNLIIALSHNFSVTRFFTMPYIERKFWNKAVPIESKKHIPVAFEELGYDFHAEPIGEKQKIGVLFSVTPKKTTEFLTQLFKTIGLNVIIIEPVVYTFYRLSHYLTEGKDNYIFVYSEGDDVYLSVVWKKIPVLYRYISFSKTPSFSERRSFDLKGSLMFLERNIPAAQIKDVFVFSTTAVDSLSSQVKREIQIDPLVINLNTKLETDDKSFANMISSSASLFNKVKTDYVIDISENQKSKRMIVTINKFFTTLTFSVVGAFLLLYLLNTFRSYQYSKEISYHYSQMTQISEFKNTSAADVERKVKEISKIAQLISRVYEKREYFAPKLSAIADTIPKEVWIKVATFENPPAIDPSNPPSVNLILEGETYLVGESRSYYLDFFVKELKKKEAFKICSASWGRLDYEIKEPENILSIGNERDYRSFISKIKLTCNGKKQ